MTYNLQHVFDNHLLIRSGWDKKKFIEINFVSTFFLDIIVVLCGFRLFHKM